MAQQAGTARLKARSIRGFAEQPPTKIYIRPPPLPPPAPKQRKKPFVPLPDEPAHVREARFRRKNNILGIGLFAFVCATYVWSIRAISKAPDNPTQKNVTEIEKELIKEEMDKLKREQEVRRQSFSQRAPDKA